jgi:hypothetical protein
MTLLHWASYCCNSGKPRDGFSRALSFAIFCACLARLDHELHLVAGLRVMTPLAQRAAAPSSGYTQRRTRER